MYTILQKRKHSMTLFSQFNEDLNKQNQKFGKPGNHLEHLISNQPTFL